METILTIKCFDTCVYRLSFPAFFMNKPITTHRKIFTWLFQFDWYKENEETIIFLDREMPRLPETIKAEGEQRIEKAEKVWRERMADYQKEYLNPDPATFPADWTKAKKREERAIRKQWNATQMIPVKDAKAAYESAKKQAPKNVERAEMLYEIYRNAKNQ